MLALVALQAAADPTGLLALVGWSGALPSLAAGAWTFAPYLVFVPVLLGVLWWATARAGERFWTHTAGIVLAVLLAQAATTLVMTGDLAAAGYAAGFVAGKAIPAALIVAALTRLFGGPRKPRTLAPGLVWPPAVLFAALAPLLAGLWWTGAVYAPGIPAARPDRGILSVIVAMLLIAAATALCLRWMRTRVPGVLGGWLAALLAGGLVGVVQATIGLIADGGFAGDMWPLMAAYIAVADGLAFGACAGWAVGIGAVVTDRVGAARSSRVPLIAAASVAVLALAASLVLPSVGTASAASAEATPPAGMLRAEASAIADGAGNQVLLRGVNVNNLVDFYQPRPEVPATTPLTEADFAGMAEYGFTVSRLNISWSALEPERGTLDPAYLAQIRDAVGWAADNGIYTVLDMHQDGWWNGATAEGTACRPGTETMWGYDGAPEWATITDAAPRCQFTGRDISPAGNRAFQNFYFDTDGVQSALAETWGTLAAEFRDEPMVAGFDLLNEPGFGETAPVTTSHMLGAFYGKAIEQIRAAGAPQIVFVEPSIFWSGLGFDTGPSAGFTTDRNIVFSPHLYAESITMDRSLGIPPIVGLERQFDLAQRVAAEYDAPLWSGEYGYWGEDADVLARLTRYADAEDAHLLGSAYWVWKQACGDPQNGIQEFGNALMMQDCATGGDAPPKADLLEVLSRAYPQQAPGTLTALEAEGAAVQLAGRTDARSCGLRVWVPGTAEPAVEATGITDIEATAVPGGWIVTGCAGGEYSLSTR
ncbi:Aryl-phospho-beta-D-glucosidase BglC, GH1 family [Microterricola viridarii]|uniref:Aryl-phospho-beta-D-glucosidase BglC, GH1 family n=1 Tax=Microterricola viridarii TaxID=412690 RepID=A0A1H1TFN4_9MICO|nr:Aryl-phospho-beta-D-glucosidase BglC, GH1 family [Microterricola viridarii]